MKDDFDIEELYKKIDGFDKNAQRLVAKFVDVVESVIRSEENPHPLPKKAPELYENRTDRDENPRDFISRVYSKWLDGTLTRPDLRRLDQKLYHALANWEHRFGRVDYDLSTLKEKNDRIMIKSFITDDDNLELRRRHIHSKRVANKKYKSSPK